MTILWTFGVLAAWWLAWYVATHQTLTPNVIELSFALVLVVAAVYSP